MRVEDALEECPLVAIIRGVRPAEVLDIADAVYSAGIRVIEVPLNSPEPLESIARLKAVEDRMAFGAGTVLRAGAVDAVAQAGGQIIIAPNTDVGVIRRALERGLTPMPGFATASEAFCAIEAGAKYLKLFPASTYGTGHLKALKEVLPPEAVVFPVGGVGPEEMADWWRAGARGFGLGGALYKAGDGAEDVRARAVRAVEAVGALR
jgi:2-dehydro-3-deoxyphosphogalactonate aldolase